MKRAITPPSLRAPFSAYSHAVEIATPARQVRSRYVQGSAFNSTLLVVTGFTRPEFKIEVEVTAAR